MIALDTPLTVIRGTCSVCKSRVSQVLLQNAIEGKVTRHWLKVDEVYSAGDEGDGLCGWAEHCCRPVEEGVS